MSPEQNKKVVLRWREEIWNKRNVNIIDKLHAPDGRIRRPRANASLLRPGRYRTSRPPRRWRRRSA